MPESTASVHANPTDPSLEECSKTRPDQPGESITFEEDGAPVDPMILEALRFLGIHTDDRLFPCFIWSEGLCKVLAELRPEGLRILRDRRLQIEVRYHDCDIVRAYFPMHRRRWIAKYVNVRPTTRVLLVISEEAADKDMDELLERELRIHLGHTLIYLQNARWPNECADAEREWKKWSK